MKLLLLSLVLVGVQGQAHEEMKKINSDEAAIVVSCAGGGAGPGP